MKSLLIILFAFAASLSSIGDVAEAPHSATDVADMTVTVDQDLVGISKLLAATYSFTFEDDGKKVEVLLGSGSCTYNIPCPGYATFVSCAAPTCAEARACTWSEFRNGGCDQGMT